MSSHDEFPDEPSRLPLRDLVVMGAIIAILAILASTLIPSVCGPRGTHRRVQCSNHLAQLYKLGTVSNTRGKWPTATGEDLWLGFVKSQPPLIEGDQVEVLFCPVKGEEVTADATDYRGPANPVGRLRASDPVGADKPGNHGPRYGGNVLRMDGSVLEHPENEVEWRRCETLLKP